ncbi:MAG: RDD family protein, partial [Methylotenera sp.]|nr:RDD family protein [Methylotenera sp.]
DKAVKPLTFKAATLRYVVATASLMLLGLGFLWALIDRDRCYLHDRLLKNRITAVPRNTTS